MDARLQDSRVLFKWMQGRECCLNECKDSRVLKKRDSRVFFQWMQDSRGFKDQRAKTTDCHRQSKTKDQTPKTKGLFTRLKGGSTMVFQCTSMHLKTVVLPPFWCTCQYTNVWHASFMCVTCLIYICNTTHSYVWLDSFIRPSAYWPVHPSTCVLTSSEDWGPTLLHCDFINDWGP